MTSALSALALVLFAFYLINLLGQVVPLQITAPTWQLRFTHGAITLAPLTLIGLALLQLATYIDPGNGKLAAQRRNLSALAGLAMLGFLLLIPLQMHASYRSLQTMNAGRQAKIQQVRQNLNMLRQEIKTANSLDDLQNRIKTIQAPDLILDASSLGKPLPQIKQSLLASVDRSETQLNQAFVARFPLRIWVVLQRCLQGVLSCLALAFGFAALAQRPHCNFSILQELQRWSIRFSRGPRRPI